jgi:flagellar protein FlgJ
VPYPNRSLTKGGTVADTSRVASSDNLAKAGQQFEAVFTGMMLKSMRAAQLADPLFDSKAIDTFRDMQDQLTVKAMAEHTPLGIGKAMTDFLARGAGLDTAAPLQPDVNAAASSP